MTELAGHFAAAPALANAPTPETAAAAPKFSSRELNRRLVRIYIIGCLAAVVVTFTLALLGLELTLSQWIDVLVATPAAVAFYTLPDVYVIWRHLQPISDALARLDRGEAITPTQASAGLARALNLPFYSFLRVTLLHGPMATVSVLLVMVGSNLLAGAGFALWQALIFAAAVGFFASPAHGILEFFGISRAMVGPIERISQFASDGIRPEDQRRLISIGLRSKLFYLSIVVAAAPLVFFACSVLFKVDRMLTQIGVMVGAEQMLPLWQWVAGVIAVCVGLSLTMAALTASEVSRSAARLAGAMREVAAENLDTDLTITSTDEYADLFRGFNHMVRGLRDGRLLEITQGLANELNLDSLIQRIMAATCDLLDAERATLFVYDAKRDELWSRFAGGFAGEIRIPSHAGIAGSVFSSAAAENIADAYADPRFDRSSDQRTGYRTRSILAMPILNKAGTRVGVTEVLNKKDGGTFTARDEVRLRAFTAQIAVMLENAQLFDEVLSVKNYNENILRSTSNGMVTLDEEGRVATANEAALAILKVKRDEFVGLPAGHFFTGANGWVKAAIDRVAETGERDISVDAVLQIGGKDSSVNLTAQPLFGPDHAPIGSMLVFEDVTAEKRVKATMARYMSKEVVDQVLAGGEAELGGKTQTVSILFSDVRDFTSISEALGPRETVSLLNEYFGQMVEVVQRHGGILDKYIGDAIMALFGVPFRQPEDADHAIAVANGMLVSLGAFNRGRRSAGKLTINIGVGIATGEVVVGNIGAPTRMEYTAIGDSVNLASRLEGANKYYHTNILVDETTVRALRQPVTLREIDLLRVKGKDQPVAVYEVLDHRAAILPNLTDVVGCFGEGLEAYRARRWQRAIDCFGRVLKQHAGDAPSEIYIERCRHYIEAPPEEDWGGVWVMTEK
jgi:adenylate cyclase